MSDWFDHDEFWAEFAPVLFGPERWAKTPEGVDRILKLLELPPGSRILDLCCGPGRHSLELARRGYGVTGVDRTVAYLDEARRRAEAERLDVEWVLSDMRSFAREESFDGAINIFTSFGYFDDPEDDFRVAGNLFRSLRPGGRVVVDVLGKEPIAREFRPRDWHWVDAERGIIILEERWLAPDWGGLRFTWTLLQGSERRSETLTLRLYSGTELAALFRRAGFGMIALYGGIDGRPYDQDAARLVLVATKAAAAPA